MYSSLASAIVRCRAEFGKSRKKTKDSGCAIYAGSRPHSAVTTVVLAEQPFGTESLDP